MKNKTIDDFVKVTFSTVQDDEDEINKLKDGKIYGYYTDTVGGLVDGHKIYITPASDLNTSMINREWGDFMKYTGYSVEDIVDFIDRNVVNNPKTFNLSSF